MFNDSELEANYKKVTAEYTSVDTGTGTTSDSLSVTKAVSTKQAPRQAAAASTLAAMATPKSADWERKINNLAS
jgi:hypothetical protein